MIKFIVMKFCYLSYVGVSSKITLEFVLMNFSPNAIARSKLVRFTVGAQLGENQKSM